MTDELSRAVWEKWYSRGQYAAEQGHPRVSGPLNGTPEAEAFGQGYDEALKDSGSSEYDGDFASVTVKIIKGKPVVCDDHGRPFLGQTQVGIESEGEMLSCFVRFDSVEIITE